MKNIKLIKNQIKKLNKNKIIKLKQIEKIKK